MLRTSRPAQESSIRQTATCATTRKLRSRAWLSRRPNAVPSFLSAETRSARAACNAGSNPAATADSNARNAVTPSTRPSGRKSRNAQRRVSNDQSGGRKPSTTGLSSCSVHVAKTSPATAPSAQRSTFSVSNCRNIRPRLAPSVSRTPISCWRVMPRASSRLATFVQAMSNTIPKPNSTGVATLRKRASSGIVMKRMPGSSATESRPPSAGCSRAMRATTASRSDLACASVTPGRNRPIRRSGVIFRFVRPAGCRIFITGTQPKGGAGWSPENSSAVTPITV